MEKFTDLASILTGDLFDTPENRVITSDVILGVLARKQLQCQLIEEPKDTSQTLVNAWRAAAGLKSLEIRTTIIDSHYYR